MKKVYNTVLICIIFFSAHTINCVQFFHTKYDLSLLNPFLTRKRIANDIKVLKKKGLTVREYFKQKLNSEVKKSYKETLTSSGLSRDQIKLAKRAYKCIIRKDEKQIKIDSAFSKEEKKIILHVVDTFLKENNLLITVTVKSTKKRIGNHAKLKSIGNGILFSWKVALQNVPIEHLEYVLLHELSHLLNRDIEKSGVLEATSRMVNEENNNTNLESGSSNFLTINFTNNIRYTSLIKELRADLYGYISSKKFDINKGILAAGEPFHRVTKFFLKFYGTLFVLALAENVINNGFKDTFIVATLLLSQASVSSSIFGFLNCLCNLHRTHPPALIRWLALRNLKRYLDEEEKMKQDK